MDDTDTEVGAVVESNGFAQQPNLIELIQSEMRELASADFVHIPVAGYEKVGLTIKYRQPESGRELEQIAQKVMRETKDNYSRGLTIALDTILHLHDGIYVKPVFSDVEDHVMLDPSGRGTALTFADPELASVFGVDDPLQTSARQLVKRAFGGNELAILDHFEKLQRWLANAKADLSNNFWSNLGESAGVS